MSKNTDTTNNIETRIAVTEMANLTILKLNHLKKRC